jgi:DNA-damage-inducible protein J
MMDTVVRARVDEADKAAAVEVLREMGLTISDLLRIVVIRTAKTGQIPFELGLSPVNREVIREIEEGRATKASHDVDMDLPKGSPFGKQKDRKK